MNDKFQIVGIRPLVQKMPVRKEKWYKGKPVISVVLLGIIVCACFGCNMIMTKEPTYLDLMNHNVSPNREFLFGTDTLGRDMFSMIWYGGRISLLIGFLATFLTTVIAIVLGAISGSGPAWLDSLCMRLTEILISVPNLLLVILIQAFLGKANVFSIAFVIGITSWTSIAKVVRMEVRQIRNSDYIIASKCMGGSFCHVLWKHLTPNFISSIMFMVVMNIRSAMIAESTLSFMGVGLPIEQVSWGSMLSLADKALLTDSWWMIWIPGMFLVVTLICITNIGNYLRKNVNRKQSNL